MDIDVHDVMKVIGNNQRFVSPFSEPYGYYIWTTDDESISNIEVQLYLEKLKYMVENLDILLQQAFNPSFYNFYGVNRSILSYDSICQLLLVESFVLNVDTISVACCLSNSQIMYRHYIECLWNNAWELIYTDT